MSKIHASEYLCCSNQAENMVQSWSMFKMFRSTNLNHLSASFFLRLILHINNFLYTFFNMNNFNFSYFLAQFLEIHVL